MQYPVPKPLVVIVGPTAVGKSRIAIEVARRLNGEIVSADSRLFYRGMDIGTAKPGNEDRRQIKHHLIDIANPDEIVSLRVFQSKAQDCINKILKKKRLPILVGGTGQYIHATTEGWIIPSQIDPRNVRRTIRALEVILGTGKLFSDQRIKVGAKYDLKIIGLFLPREILYHRIDERINQMISNGLIEEVKNLLAKCYSPDLPSMSAIGYHEIAGYIQNKITYEDAIMLMKRRTRQFVRRQANWFKSSDPHIHWLVVSDRIVEEITKFIQSTQDWITE
jgi:tRNA dimethylallyltransferase